jgi:hypothetical protein
METAKETIQSIGDKIPEITVPDASAIKETASKGLETVTSGITSVKDSVANTISEFSSKDAIDSSQSFLTSNGLIAKFVFLLFIVIVFLFLMNLGISLIGYFSQPSKNPYVLAGMVPGNSNITVPQDPSNPDSVTVLRSNNKETGLEFTWSFWILAQNLGQTPAGGIAPTYSHIFNKGNSTYGSNGIATVNNGPGVYLGNDASNTLLILMDTVNTPATIATNSLAVTNFPLKKWVHVAIRMENTMMDVYVNGTISARKTYTELPKQNYEDVHIGKNNGFNGQLSDIAYYSKALGVFEINNIILKGPNLTQSSAVKSNIGFYSYLSNIWYGNKL